MALVPLDFHLAHRRGAESAEKDTFLCLPLRRTANKKQSALKANLFYRKQDHRKLIGEFDLLQNFKCKYYRY